MTNAISAAGLALIRDAEGFRAEPARLPSGDWVVGYGHLRVADAGAPVTEQEAESLLAMDVAPAERLVNETVAVSLTQSQFDALVSFAMSVGAEAFVQSQVLRRVNAGAHVAAACAMDAWRKADIDGSLEVVDALVRRRAAEKALYLKASEGAPSVFLRAKLDYAASVLGAPVAFAQAPNVEDARAPRPRPDACARLSEILNSEPATETLLLTQVVPADAMDEAGEIVTAHAKPAARALEVEAPHLSRIPKKRAPESLWRKLANRFDFSQSFETAGLVALILFGAGLVLVGASLVYGGVEDGLMLVACAALVVPGLAAIAGGGWALRRGAPVEA